jgi:hypothetical protein
LDTPGTAESNELAQQRAVAQRMLEQVFATSHAHIISTNANGDIASIWAAALGLCIDAPKDTLMDSLAALVDLSRAPPSSWPATTRKISELKIAFSEASSLPGFALGPRFLSEFTMRALQKPAFDYIRFDIALLNKVPGVITTDRIVQDLGAAHSTAVAAGAVPTSHQQAHLANSSSSSSSSSGSSGAPRPKSAEKRICFAYRDHGNCRNKECIFVHAARPQDAQVRTGRCVECFSDTHGFRECPKRIAREKAHKVQTANLASVTKDLAELKAQVAAAAPPPVSPPPLNDTEYYRVRAEMAQRELAAVKASSWPHFDPYAQYGPGGPGGPPPPAGP